jgi:hypothetical protein
MNIYIFALFIIILIIIICYNSDISYKEIVNDIQEHPKFKYTIGPLPYFNDDYNDSEVARFYNFVDILNTMKKCDYTNNNRYEQNKISIKLDFFKKNGILDFNKLKNFVEYANTFNIMVGFSSMGRDDRIDELNTYLKLLNYGYNNLFITLATYHSDIDQRVDTVLKHNGTIRLVKGWYKDGDVHDWDSVSENYLRNAKKMVKSGKFHMLATHDFDILKNLYDIYGYKMDIIEIIFFRFNKDFITREIDTFPYVIRNKSFYKPYGKICMSFLYSLKKMDIWREINRRYF